MNDDTKALSSALGTDMTPKPFKEPDYGKLRTTSDVFAEQKRVGDLQAKAAGELKKAELTQQANLAGEQAKAATQVAEKAQTYVDDNKRKEAEFPYPEFHPTKDNAESLGGLFSIVSTIGIMLGSSGKQSGLNAMNAMTGMMKGWQQGRSDLFKREKEEFDKEFNRIKVIRENLRKDLEDYMKLLPYDKEAAMYKAAEISAKTGRDSIINSFVQKGQADNALKLLESAGKLIEKKEEIAMRKAERMQPTYQFYASGDKVIAVNTKNPSDIKEVTNKELASAIKLGTKPSEKGAGVAAGQIERMTNAMTQVSGAIKAISDLPITTTAPVFGQKEFKGLFSAPLSVLNQKMSAETSQMMAGRMVGVARNLASLETGGAATGLAGLTDSIQAGISIPAGAKLHVALDRLAEMRRIVEDAARGALASSKYTADQKQLIRENLLIVENAIPFTLEDVAQATIASKGKSPRVPKEDRNLTFTQYIQKYGLAKPEPIESAIQSESGGSQNKETLDRNIFESPAKSAFGAYEPDKYKYGYENGRLYREEK